MSPLTPISAGTFSTERGGAFRVDGMVLASRAISVHAPPDIWSAVLLVGFSVEQALPSATATANFKVRFICLLLRSPPRQRLGCGPTARNARVDSRGRSTPEAMHCLAGLI